MKRWFYILFTVLSFHVFAEPLTEGKDYVVVPSAAISSHSGKATVTEFFSYGCPACFNLENPLQAWVKQHEKTVDFTQIPVIYHPEWMMYAKAYYTAKALGILNNASPLLFKAIHEERKPLTEPTQMAAFFTQTLNVDPNVAESAFTHLTQVDVQINDGMALASKLSITTIPSFIVNGRYKTDLMLAKTPERLLIILNELSHKTEPT